MRHVIFPQEQETNIVFDYNLPNIEYFQLVLQIQRKNVIYFIYKEASTKSNHSAHRKLHRVYVVLKHGFNLELCVHSYIMRVSKMGL